MAVNIEIKNDLAEPDRQPPDRFAAEVVGAALEVRDSSELIISSFDAATLEAVRRFAPDISVGWLLGFGADGLEALSEALLQGFTALHPFVLSVTSELVEAAHACGVAIHTWTVNAIHDLSAMSELGVDLIITDDVALARRVVDTGV
jgi:glycerophosphoryl diester phosphodiesterase